MAARIAVRTVAATPTAVSEVRFVLFDAAAFAAFRAAHEELSAPDGPGSGR